MIGIVLVSHGALAAGLKDAAEMIVGPQERFIAIGMQASDKLDDLRTRIEAAVDETGKDETLVLVDILGGNPANASSQLAHKGIQVICGVNLPMLLEILTQRENVTVQKLATIATQAAQEGVINFTQQLEH